MDRYEITDRFARMWKSSREAAGKSQDFMARSLGVSKKTVQNWEAGISCPSQEKGFEWFHVLDQQPLPYYLRLLYPDKMDLDYSESNERIDHALQIMIASLPDSTKRELLYLLYGEHGSSPVCVIEMITAHLQAPLRSRLNVAESIYTNYEIAEAQGLLKQPDRIQPDMEMLKKGIDSGKEAIKRGKETYTVI